ncbi:unnamed protein product [Polarella glacialis]|uniref:HEAT repeat-containing protein 1 n=1 Tax=Polarella glacialis TaxID=89957 RepID=A0A813ENM4_POLGL|nr:unnamed protein product [Polarella glacialis]
MSRYLDLMKRDRTPEMRLLLLRAWCSLCVALVNSAMTEPGDTMASDDSAFSRRFGAAAVALRRRRAAQSSELSSEDQRRAAQVLGTAFTLLMSLWQGWKDLTARVAVMEAFGHFSLVIPRDQFLTNADSLLELLLGLLSRQATALGSVAPLPPMALVRGTCLLLQACIDADPEMLTLENTLQTLTSSLFAWTVAGGPLQYLQGSLANEALQSQAELLRCFDVLAETFSRESLGFLLQKAKGGRDERLAALLVLRHLVGGDIGGAGASTTSRSNGGGASPRFTGSSPGVNWLSGQVVVAIVEGLQALLADGDPAVGLMLGELIVGMVGADMLSPRAASVAGEAKPTAVPKPEHVTALLSFLIRQTAKGPATDVAEQGYVAKLVTKGYAHSADGPSCEEVRSRAGLVLGQLAGSLKPPMRPVLWPMLLRALVNPAMLPGLPVLCRAATQILQSVKSSSEGDAAYRDAGLAQAMHASSGGPQPETLFLWLLVCAHNPLEPPGLGLSVLRCLESLSSLIHPMLGEIWEAPSKRLHTLCAYLEDGVPGDQEFWASALSQEVHFFLSALPEHDDLPARLVDILGGLLKEVSRKDSREASTLAAGAGLGTSDPSDLHRAAIFNLSGVCLSHLGQASKASAAMDALFAYASGTSGSAGTSDQLLGTPAVRRAFARGIGLAAKRHFDLALSALARAAKTDAATRRTGSLAQSFFGKSNAVHIAEQLRGMLFLALGFCAVHAPSPHQLQEKACEHILKPLLQALVQEKTVAVLQSAVEAVRLACNALGATPDALAQCDPFLASRAAEAALQHAGLASLGQDSPVREALASRRSELVEALLPFVEPPKEDDEARNLVLEELLCPALDALSSLISLPLDLSPDLYAAVLERGLHVLIISIPRDGCATTRPSMAGRAPVSPGNMTSAASSGSLPGDSRAGFALDSLSLRIQSVTRLIKSLLFHAHSWLGVSRLLQAVHAAGASCHVEFTRWTCTQIIGVLCRFAPIVIVPVDGQEEGSHGDIGDWSECLALLLPRMGDSSKAVVAAAIDAVQQLLSRCEWTAKLRIGTSDDSPGSHYEDQLLPAIREARGASGRPEEKPLYQLSGSYGGLTAEVEELGGDPAPPSQQLVGALVSHLPPTAIPALVQHLMPAMHDADSHAALTGVDALHLILLSSCEKLDAERAANLVSTIFEEVEKVRHSSVRQLVLSCIKALALHHFDSVIQELLEMGPDFNSSIMGALQVMAKEKTLLIKMLNHLTDTLNNSDPGTAKRPNRQVLAATVALGHLFTVNDSSIGVVVKKYFSQLFGTFLLRIGTTTEGLPAQQTAGAFMNFLHASQNDSMAMALEGNRLAKVTKEFYDEVISELTSLFCRHQPRKRETLLQFIQPFLARPLSGHRVAAVTILSQLLLSGSDSSLQEGFLEATLQSVLIAVDDPDITVRKQGVRGLGNLAVLWQQGLKDMSANAADETIQQVLQQLCRSLSDEAAVVRREAVLAMQRACQVQDLPVTWQRFLLTSCPRYLPGLLDAEDAVLRGASLDLLGRLCELAAAMMNARSVVCEGSEVGESLQTPTDNEDVPGNELTVRLCSDADGTLDPEFAASLQSLVVQCVVRLEDSSSAVGAAASRCLHQLTGVQAASQPSPSAVSSSLHAAEARELLQRREHEQMDFEQFVFPFVALIHEPGNISLLLRRLDICKTYLAAPAPQLAGADGSAQQQQRQQQQQQQLLTTTGGSRGPDKDLASSPGSPPRTAAGFMAAAFVRCLGEATPRPSALLCAICRDLMHLLAIEDSAVRAQVARILGSFDLKTHQHGAGYPHR